MQYFGHYKSTGFSLSVNYFIFKVAMYLIFEAHNFFRSQIKYVEVYDRLSMLIYGNIYKEDTKV